MSKKIIDSVSELIQPILLERDLELVDIEYVKEGPDWFLRVYLDKDGGIDLIECSLVSERLSKLLDEHDLIKEAYYLEVSSPGAERPLKTKEDILQHVGHNVYVYLYTPVDGEKEFEGILTSFSNDEVVIEYKIKTRVKQVSIAYKKVAKARVAVTFKGGTILSSELFDALNFLEKDKGIDKDVLLEALEAALISAYKKNVNSSGNVRVEMNEEAGTMKVYARKTVVEDIENELEEILLDEAKEINLGLEVDDVVDIEVTPKDFGRIAAQAAKQVVTQRVREAERGVILSEYEDREEDVMTGIIQRVDSNFVYVDLGKIEAKLAKQEQVSTEEYNVHDRIKVYVNKVENTSKGPQILISRAHPGLLKRLFEMEVPEIYDGTVEVKSISREAGDRSKISVYAADEEIDPVGSCVGPKGQRVQAVVDELNGEKIDIVHWSEDPVIYVSNALSPSKVIDVLVDEENNSTIVIVPDYQLSLAIGKRGQNARLAAKLTGWKIDIKSESAAKEEGIEVEVNQKIVENSEDDLLD